jgi:hypothetical protein
MEEKSNKKIVLPKELQIKIWQFFLKTSIPRIKAEKNKSSIQSKKG